MKFDPTKAEAVEDDVFDKFMEHMNARAQSKQLQQAADSLRILLEMTRRDSEDLLSKYLSEFDAWVKKRDEEMRTKVEESIAGSITGSIENAMSESVAQSSAISAKLEKVGGKMGESIDRVIARTDSISTSLGRVEKLVKDLTAVPKGVDPDNGSIRTILSEVSNIRAQLETPREDKMGILVDMLKAMKETAPQKKSWAFTIERDDFARIKNVTATSS